MIFEYAAGKLITSGFVELHSHLRQPGFEYKEDFASGMASAQAGGYGIICAMPNTNPVCDNVETLRFIQESTQKIGGVKVLQVCAMTKGLNSDELVDFKTLSAAGAVAFSNDGRPVENMETFKQILSVGKELGLVMMSHAENSSFSPYDNRSEYTAVERELKVLEDVDGQLHFCHISTKESLELIRNAKKKGLNVTCETAPHYFTFSKDDIINDEARFKMNPPLRTKEDVQAVMEALQDGTIDVIATDHAPHSIEEKCLPFDKAPFGIVGLETAFSLGFTRLVRTGKLELQELIKKMTINPAKIIGVEPLGKIEIDLDKKWVVKAADFKTKAKISPFEGMCLYGKIERCEYV